MRIILSINILGRNKLKIYMIFQLVFIILKLIIFKYNINKKRIIISKIQSMNILSQ